MELVSYRSFINLAVQKKNFFFLVDFSFKWLSLKSVGESKWKRTQHGNHVYEISASKEYIWHRKKRIEKWNQHYIENQIYVKCQKISIIVASYLWTIERNMKTKIHIDICRLLTHRNGTHAWNLGLLVYSTLCFLFFRLLALLSPCQLFFFCCCFVFYYFFVKFTVRFFFHFPLSLLRLAYCLVQWLSNRKILRSSTNYNQTRRARKTKVVEEAWKCKKIWDDKNYYYIKIWFTRWIKIAWRRTTKLELFFFRSFRRFILSNTWKI